MKRAISATIMAAGVTMLSATSLLALGLNLGGVEANVEVGHGGVNAGVSVGGSGGINAGVGVGGSGASIDASIGGTSTTPGAGTPGATVTPVATSPTGATSSGTLAPALAVLIGKLVVTSDGKALGYVEDAEMAPDGRPVVRVRLLESLGAKSPVVRLMLRKLPKDADTVRVAISMSQVMRSL